MKKFLSLLLALLFCLSFIVSCTKENASSSTETSSLSSSSESSSNMPSSSKPTQEPTSEPSNSNDESSSELSDESVSNKESANDEEISSTTQEKPNHYYEMMLENNGNDFENNKLFTSYQELINEVGGKENLGAKIDESIFEENNVCVVRVDINAGLVVEGFCDFKYINDSGYIKAYINISGRPELEFPDITYVRSYFVVLPKTLFVNDMEVSFEDLKVLYISLNGESVDQDTIPFEGVYW